MSFEEQLLKVENIKGELFVLNRQYTVKKYELEKQMRVLQEVCQHNFIRESDGDYHKPSFYYICKTCNLTKSNETLRHVI
jgi:hypothetical protein